MKRLSQIAVALAVFVVLGSLNAQPAIDVSARSETLAENVRLAVQFVQNLQANVRREKDVIKLSCVNDKFVELKAQANVFDIARADLRLSVDSESSGAVMPRLEAAATAVEKIREQAAACAGTVELATSASSFSAPPIDDDPTVGLPFDDISGDPTIEPPGYASPYN